MPMFLEYCTMKLGLIGLAGNTCHRLFATLEGLTDFASSFIAVINSR